MNRRHFIQWLAVGELAGSTLKGCYWPDEGLFNDCPPGEIPAVALDHDLVHFAWEGIDRQALWDCYVHFIGQGGGAFGAWLNPQMTSWWHPIQHLQFRYDLNAVCRNPNNHANQSPW